eukprot:TRINITY_DN343_c0_g1_i1.p1 TRINITY_DN343_c0_g1~~TRINITY_DN343_c0_g1_i1.p1  ORF type:complete len:141 (+),score=18.05 TRINITY_DN343_c0_g1_i1:229-651(+)
MAINWHARIGKSTRMRGQLTSGTENQYLHRMSGSPSTYQEHSGRLYKKTTQTLGNIFSLGISAAFQSGRILFYDCCNEDETQPGYRCSRPHYKCGSCDRTLRSIADMTNGCRKKCVACGADELSSDSTGSSLCHGFREAS